MPDEQNPQPLPDQFRVSRDPRVESRIELLKQIMFPSMIRKQAIDSNGDSAPYDSPYFLLNTKEYGLADLSDFEVGTIWMGYGIVSDALEMGLDNFAEKFSGEIINYLLLTRSKKGLQLRHFLKDYSEQKIVTAEEQNRKGAWGNPLQKG